MTSIKHSRYPTPPGDSTIPLSSDGDPVFAEPWEAKIFALVVNVYDQGRFEWKDFQQLLVEEISCSEGQGDPQSYYVNWAIAAERLFESLAVVDRSAIDQRVSELRPDDKTIRLSKSGEV
jgi:nitrile hydratase accessory protein